ncbi:WXG100 family type VII secretion target [Actinokineospora globicatena]|uniref:WXG100 family type VII secretion target n=1 Tax=Actinokineospora globicatena TaxID=103729 RepID=UPI0020A59E04|nr:WXG100 family type VII secretion target [Actinokineospora globicatena]MCP2301496.1 hypothetical protein [Actinokineospora globicatena]GLW76857.1 hypothetical protein Aglo01_13390 [Actinokineospora globicatena]GLW83690.1 hypothetical protein Aglo02_13300 [Actinokineospora globicatena]
MSFYGDPDELDRLAGRVEQHAEEVRGHGSTMVRQAQAMRWKSIAADRCRETVANDRKALDAVATKLDEAAAALRRHAQQVRELIAAIKRIGEAVVNWFNGAINRFNQAVDRFNQAVRDIANAVASGLGIGGSPPQPPRPPWEGWQYQPHTLPPAGDKQWLDVGTFMRARGVA